MNKRMNAYNDIGIDSQLDWKRIRKLLMIGIFVAVMVFVGDLLLGYGVEDETLSGLERSLSRYIARSDTVLFWSSLLGVIGIPLECLCWFGIYRLIASRSQRYAHIYRSGILGCLTFGGCGVHLPCLAAVYVYKHMLTVSPEHAYDIVLQFAEYFLLPGTILFFVFFAVLCYAQIAAFSRGLTPYPKWCWVFSLPIPMLLVLLLHKLVGNVAWAHGLATGWINIGNLWMFGGLLVMLERAKRVSEPQARKDDAGRSTDEV
ncbi:MAG: hypothetical protein LIP11_09235 [Clostridiales bacterium]|nr:hypothetical protein [Clostridiales bacterium]